MIIAAVVAPLTLVAVLAWAAVTKVRAPGSALSSMQLLRLPTWLAQARVATVFPWTELALAGALLLAPAGPAYVVVAALTTVLMATYWGLIARGLTMDPRPTCGCFGAIGSPIRPLTLVRNTLLVALAGVTLAVALAGSSTVSLARDLGTQGWWWLVAVAVVGAVVGLVILSERPRLQAGPPPAPTASVTADAPDEDGLLDYERSPIPSQLLLDADGAPHPLRRLATGQAQLLLWVTCGCGRSHTIVEKAAAWRKAMPQIGIRLISTMSPEATAESFESYGEDFLYDPEHTAFIALEIRNDPAAVLLGADGLLAGGPVAGQDDVLEFVEDVMEALSEAPAPEAVETLTPEDGATV